MDLLFIGFGYSSSFIYERLKHGASSIAATTRSEEKAETLTCKGVRPIMFDGSSTSSELKDALDSASHIIMSAGPSADGDPFLTASGQVPTPSLVWVGYLSTIGVYGNHDGAWVDETVAPAPRSTRSKNRLAVEQAWQAYAEARGAGCMIARLSGIYGPGRSPLERVRSGKARRIIKEGQIFNRIHGEDIGRVVSRAAIQNWSGIMNVTDDEPEAAATVLEHAASLLGIDPPPAVAFEDAEMNDMARSFYSESKRASNALSKREFGPYLYPTYREGLASLLS
ncbi:MAG: NAD-dependent epimerase/dehydratase family protein [Pseudomonadota bacterium]